MKVFSFPLGVLATACSLASMSAAQIQVAGQTFTVPDGLVVEKVAASDLVQRPVSASFDDQGRLYVTDSSGSNDKPAEQLKNPTHRILRLEDSDGDGRFDKSVVFADKVMFPQGCLWHAGSVYVAGPPSIWKFTDTNNDAVADQRVEWFKGGTLTGCANDIHGPHLGPDGYLYWTKGAFEEQTHKLGNGRVLKDRAAHIYRARPDGSDIDVIMSGGMDNPVEVAFTPEGEAVFTSTFIDFSQPGFRDGIGHAAYGAVFGKANGVLDDGRVKRTGSKLAQPFIQLGASAPSGLCRYESTGFGSEYRDNLFATSFNLHKVTRHLLRPEGATFASADSDFVVSDSLDFHPTDVLEDADGSLLIVDTGGWYKLCCPSSQLAKADVLGGIYRVKKVGTPRLSLADLRNRQQRLTGAPSMAGFTLPAILKRAIWQNHPTNAAWFRALLQRPDATNASGAQVVRVCAEGLGRLKDREAVPLLLQVAGVVGARDEVLRMSLTQALIDIGDFSALRAALRRQVSPGASPEFVRAAITALDQIEGGDLKAEELLPHLDAVNPGLRETALWIAGRHPEWGSELAGFFRQRLQSNATDAGQRSDLARLVAQFAKSPAIQSLLATVTSGKGTITQRLTALRAMAQGGLKEPPAAWHQAVALALGDSSEEIVQQAVATARTLPAPKAKSALEKLTAALLRVAKDAQVTDEVRLDAMVAVPGGLSQVDPPRFEFLLGSLAPARSVPARTAAASILARAKLSEDQLLLLTDALKTAGPMEIPRLLPAFQKVPTETLGLRLLSALRESKAGSALRPESLRPTLTNFPLVVQQKGEEFLATLNLDQGRQKSHLEGLLTEIHGKGDVRRGQTIFNSAKAACSVCHTIGYLGGKVGPDLTSIGQARSERDLLEAIVFPSASFVRSFEPMLVVTKSGDEHSGVLRKEGAEEILLATGPASEVQLSRAEIAEMRPGTVSVMPQGLDEQLSRQELADLVAFLKNTTWGPR